MYILTGLGVHQSKSDASPDGIIMNSAKETEDSGNTALADGSTDKNAEQQRSVGDVIRPIISSIQPQQQRQQIEPSKYRERERRRKICFNGDENSDERILVTKICLAILIFVNNLAKCKNTLRK